MASKVAWSNSIERRDNRKLRWIDNISITDEAKEYWLALCLSHGTDVHTLLEAKSRICGRLSLARGHRLTGPINRHCAFISLKEILYFFGNQRTSREFGISICHAIISLCKRFNGDCSGSWYHIQAHIYYWKLGLASDKWAVIIAFHSCAIRADLKH